MKKKAPPKLSQGEFSSSPFKALKQLKSIVPDTPEKKGATPPPPPEKQAVPGVDDDVLFFRAVAGIKRLNEGPASRAPKEKPRARPAAIAPEERNFFLQEVGKMALDVVFADELPDDVQPLRPQASSRLRQLKKGIIRIDYELDLHGMTRDEALHSLELFIAGAYNRGQKGVLVITGKGNNSTEGPVLQGAVSSWLRERGKVMVAEFAPAPTRLGGNGAFVVFLKEKKEAE
jgi:DNA-nicking Smr family endonuclease